MLSPLGRRVAPQAALGRRPTGLGPLIFRIPSRAVCAPVRRGPVVIRSQASGPQGPRDRPNRKFFDKVARDPRADFKGEKDGERFLSALREFDDKLEMLFRIMNPKVIPFLRDLGCDALCVGACKVPLLKLVVEIYRIPGFLGCLRTAISSGELKDVNPVAWLLLALAREVEDARQDPDVLAFLEPLREHADKSGLSITALRGLEVALAGSKATIASSGNGFVALEDLESGPDSGEGGLMEIEAALLDRQFRLVREDMVHALREVVSGFTRNPTSYNVGMSRQRNVFSLDQVLGSTTVPDSCIVLQAFLHPDHPIYKEEEAGKGPKGEDEKGRMKREENHMRKERRKREEFWDKGHGVNVLKLNSLVCLVPYNREDDSMLTGPDAPPIVFGTVARRDTKEMGLHAGSIIVGLSIEEGAGSNWLLRQTGCGRVHNTLLVQVSTSFFSFKPLLECLKSMTSVPMAEELVHGNPALPATYLPAEKVQESMTAVNMAEELVHGQPALPATYLPPEKVKEVLSSEAGGLNPTQKEALVLAMTKRVALIQGPPGTGKTHVGSILADVIMKHSEKKILVVAYTNHALDQFLENLLDRGHKDIVRVGGRSKSEKLEEFSLFEMSRGGADSRSSIETRRSFSLKDELVELKGEDLAVYNSRADIQQYTWALHAIHKIALGDTAMPATTCRFLAEKPAWVDELSVKLQRSTETRILRKARIIGMTSTGAVKYKELLQDPEVAPEIVMVEEAGELLEAHVLTSLSPKVEQLIMIGDHKQLPPKVDCFKLQKKSGRGFDLNVSLFERLVTNSNVEHVMLGVQHRMHPDIANLVRYTYPKLEDHSSVAEHPEVLGLAKGSRVVMIDHRELERSGSKTIAETKSKVNDYEVDMTVAVVKYLQQQGYKADQIVVLTPYLGQMLELQKAISAENEVVLSDMDINELASSTLGDQAEFSSLEPDQEKSGIRVATIDNYQEADIVVASLVRSNEEGNVGFLGHPERINVLVSRARHGLIMIGNTDTLRNARIADARKHWGAMLDMMGDMKAIQPGLPCACQQHGTRMMLTSPKAFKEQAPDGGCCLPCNFILPCGHKCQRSCHLSHENAVCTAIVHELCLEGHLRSRTCSSLDDVTCGVCVKLGEITRERDIELSRLVANAAKQKSTDELGRAVKMREIELLTQNRADAEAKLVARKEKIALKLQKRKAEKELDLQEIQGEREQVAWEKEKEQESEKELAVMQAAFDDESRARDAAEEKKQKKYEDEVRRHTAKLVSVQDSLAKIDEKAERDLQDLESLRAKATSIASGSTADVLCDATEDLRTYHTAATELPLLRAELAKYGSTSGRVDPTESTTQTLSNLLQCTSLGSQLLEYASADAARPQRTGFLSLFGSGQQKSKGARGLDLMKDGKWLEAQSFYESMVKSSENSLEGSSNKAWLSVCEVELGFRQFEVSKELTHHPGDHPARHLAAALSYSNQIQKLQEAGCKPGVDMPKLHAWAVGQALAFLLHPLSSTFPSILTKKAIVVLENSGPVFGDVSSSRFSSPLGSTRAFNEAKQNRAWSELSKKSEAFAKVVKLTGLEPVKQSLSELTLDNGGVLFVDEAYQLNPKTNPSGAQVLDALLPEMENRRGKLVVIFAGYKKQMEGLLAHNEGLPSRFTRSFTFPDYSDAELHEILQGVVSSNEPHFKLQDKHHGVILARRLGRQRGQVGFGNARAVRNAYEQALARQAARVSRQRSAGSDPDIMEDLLGPKFLDSSDSSSLKELDHMRGLHRIKKEVDNMLALVHTNAELEEQDKPIKELCLNRVFIGNPGTGERVQR
eukprot:gene24108-9683_t